MIDSSNTELSVVTIISDNNDDMEKDTSYELEAINPPTKVENDSMASGNPEDHGDSETVPEESDENDQVKENENEDTTGVFGCEGAAQQVLMYVCLSVCPQPENLPSYILLQHLESSRMFQNACRMFKNVQECMENVLEYSRMFQNIQECMMIAPEGI